jgi:hypothetical protein
MLELRSCREEPVIAHHRPKRLEVVFDQKRDRQLPSVKHADREAPYADPRATYDPARKAYSEPEIEKAGAAYTLLKSEALKTEIKAMQTAGSSLVIFPDNDSNLHVDQR